MQKTFPLKLPQNCRFTRGVRTHLKHSSLGPPNSTPQTASRSVRPFFQGSRYDRATDRQTDRPRYSVCNNRPHWHNNGMRPSNKLFNIIATDGTNHEIYNVHLCQSTNFLNVPCNWHNRKQHQTDLRRSAVPGIWLCPPKFKWFTWLNHAPFMDALPSTASNCYRQCTYKIWSLYPHSLRRYERRYKMSKLGWFGVVSVTQGHWK